MRMEKIVNYEKKLKMGIGTKNWYYKTPKKCNFLEKMVKQ